MTTSEFSNEFDVLYNNIMSNQAPGLDEYEKSVLLTKAQAEIVKNYFNPAGNKYQQGFDGSIKRQHDFSSIIKTRELSLALIAMLDGDNYKGEFIPLSDNIGEGLIDNNLFDSRSIPFIAPIDMFLSINEYVTDSDTGRRYQVEPITFDDYTLKMLKPYGYPVKRKAWRLITKEISGETASIGGINTEYSTPIALKNVYNKPLNITVNFRTLTDLVAPYITEYENSVDIVFTADPDNTSDFSLVRLWQRCLNTEEKLETYGLSTYISTEMVWPSSADDFPSKLTFTVYPGKRAVGGEYVNTSMFELIGRFSSWKNVVYYIRYVKKPVPIILVNLRNIDETLSIEGYSTITECELPESLHPEILQRAVEIAKSAYTGDINTTITTGARAE